MPTARSSLYRRHRFPPEVISNAVRLYFRFPLSLRKRPLDRTFKVDRRSANIEPVESSGLDTCRTLSFCPNPSRSRCVGWRCLPAPVDAGRGPGAQGGDPRGKLRQRGEGFRCRAAPRADASTTLWLEARGEAAGEATGRERRGCWARNGLRPCRCRGSPSEIGGTDRAGPELRGHGDRDRDRRRDGPRRAGR